MVSGHPNRFGHWCAETGLRIIGCGEGYGTMATIYNLAARLDHSGSRAEAEVAGTERPAGQSATVILFTGVRYERWVDAPEVAALDAPRAKGPASGSAKR